MWCGAKLNLFCSILALIHVNKIIFASYNVLAIASQSPSESYHKIIASNNVCILLISITTKCLTSNCSHLSVGLEPVRIIWAGLGFSVSMMSHNQIRTGVFHHRLTELHKRSVKLLCSDYVLANWLTKDQFSGPCQDDQCMLTLAMPPTSLKYIAELGLRPVLGPQGLKRDRLCFESGWVMPVVPTFNKNF